jgi:hypothetical protein
MSNGKHDGATLGTRTARKNMRQKAITKIKAETDKIENGRNTKDQQNNELLFQTDNHN